MLWLTFVVTLAAYFLLACALIGLGQFAFRSLTRKLPFAENLFLCLWLGWSAALVLLHLWNFFAPVSAYAGMLLYGFGFFAFVWFARTRIEELRKSMPSPAFLILLFASAIWLAARSMLRVATWDSGLYHLNSIRWLNEYAIVPGLGNLHGRLAFNQSFFAYVAALNFFPWFNHGHNLANSFLLLVAFAECLACLWRVFSGEQKYPLADAIAAFFIPPLIYFATTINLSAPTPNTASALLQILLFIYFAREVEGNFRDANAQQANFALVLILSATMVTVKLSNLFFAATISLVMLLLKLQPFKTAWQEKISALFYSAFAPALILLIWAARGMILSGCPVFPSTIGCVDVKWAVPLSSVQLEADKTYRFSRYQLESGTKPLAAWDWLAPWFNRVVWENKTSVLYPAGIFICVVLALVLFLAFTPAGKALKTEKKYFLIPLPVLMALLIWFFMAPDLRFAYAFFWILPISVIYVFLKIFDAHKKISALRLGFFVVANASIFFFFLQNPQVFAQISLHGYEPFRTSELIVKTTASGLEVWTPESAIGRCWDSPLPCAQEFNSKLELIGDDLQSGFMLAPK
jgi:hypothetical protein